VVVRRSLRDVVVRCPRVRLPSLGAEGVRRLPPSVCPVGLPMPQATSPAFRVLISQRRPEEHLECARTAVRDPSLSINMANNSDSAGILARITSRPNRSSRMVVRTLSGDSNLRSHHLSPQLRYTVLHRRRHRPRLILGVPFVNGAGRNANTSIRRAVKPLSTAVKHAAKTPVMRRRQQARAVVDSIGRVWLCRQYEGKRVACYR